MQDARNFIQGVGFILEKKHGWESDIEDSKMRFMRRVSQLKKSLDDYPEDLKKLVEIGSLAEVIDWSSLIDLKKLSDLEEELNPIKSPSREDMEEFLAQLRGQSRSF